MRYSKKVVAEQFVPTSTTPPSDVGIFRIDSRTLGVTGNIRTFNPDTKEFLNCITSSTMSGTAVVTAPTDAQATTTLGSELTTNSSFASNLSGWTAGAGWSWSAGSALHTAGNTETIEQNVSVTSGTTYQLTITISGRTAGSIGVALGAVTVSSSATSTSFSSTFTRTVVAGATGSLSLKVTPTSDFNGKLDDVSLKALTLGSFPAVLIVTGDGNSAAELRQSRALGNLSVGQDSGRSITVGTENTNVGKNAGYSITTGSTNANFGVNAGYAGTIANSNCNFGLSAGRNITTGGSNCCFGAHAGRYLADGSSLLVTPTNSCYFGSITKASADGVINENVFGYNAIGIGSNSCVIGSSAVTKCQLYGDIILDKTITAAGTTGNQTINKTCGSVNFAAGASSVVVTDNRVSTNSVIVATVATNDATMKTVLVAAGSGSFTITANAAATAETRVNFIVIN